MFSTLSAATTLTRLQVLNGARGLGSLAAFLLPVALAMVARLFPQQFTFGGYGDHIIGVYAAMVIPFLGIFWGTSLLGDDLQGKTLVYLWTRPVGRMRLLLTRFFVLALWIVLFVVASVLTNYAVFYSAFGVDAIKRNLLVTVWDGRALVLGALCYVGLGFLLSTLIRKALITGLVYVYVVDNLMWFLPGFLKQLSIRHYMYVLSSHPSQGKPAGMLEFLAEHDTTETQALITLLVVPVVLAVLGAFVARNREYAASEQEK
jgi:ABC-type transport system involved in multi-copper enzyme maturation permease subunit